MTHRTVRLAILFADISGSTRLYDTLGDRRAREMVARCLALMTVKLAAHRGSLIKTIGDEIMCTFPEAANALQAACDMQDAVENGKPGGATPMYVRMGFHYGEVIRAAHDVYGDAVNIAARITQVARARQVITTQAAIDALPRELRNKAQHIRRTSVKGKQEELDIFQILWKDDDMGMTRVGLPGDRSPREGQAELALRYGEQSYRLGPRNPSAMLGRADACQIVVKDGFASRQHAHIEFRFGKYVLSDQSINGTYIRFSDGQTVHVLREDLLLRASGSISLGRGFSEAAVQIIDFALGPETDAS